MINIWAIISNDKKTYKHIIYNINNIIYGQATYVCTYKKYKAKPRVKSRLIYHTFCLIFRIYSNSRDINNLENGNTIRNAKYCNPNLLCSTFGLVFTVSDQFKAMGVLSKKKCTYNFDLISYNLFIK